MAESGNKLVTSQQCLSAYGSPDPIFERKWMIVWMPPPTIKAMPRRIYCHRHLLPLLAQAVDYIIERKLDEQIRTWDGCFNVRIKRGGKTQSLHSWGLACDINSSDNIMGMSCDELIKSGRQPLSEEFLQCFRDAGFDCGGDWSSPDRMHVQIAHLPKSGEPSAMDRDKPKQ